MPQPPTPPADAAEREQMLSRLRLVDAPPEESFDRLTRLAARLVGAPVALVSMIDGQRQFFTSQYGLGEPWASARQTPLSHSFCQYVVASGERLVVEDARAHPLLAGNLAIDELGVAAYAGMPLRAAAGPVLGSFCVIDHRPRAWTPEELATLADLAASVVTEIELRRELVARADTSRELAEQRDFAMQVLNALGQGLAVTDTGGRFEYVNPAFARMVGEEPAALLGRTPHAFTHEADHPVLERGWISQAQGGGPTSVEARMLRDGVTTWYAYVTSTPFHRGSEVVGSIAAVSNITTRRRMERALQESEQLMRLFVDRVPVAVAMFDPEMRYLLTSQRWLQEYGVEEGEVLGRRHYDVFPETPAHWHEAHRQALAGHTVQSAEDRLPRRDGRVDWVSWQVFPWYTAADEVGGIIMATEVITQRKRAEQALRESEQRYRDLVENAGDLIYRTDRLGRVVYANPMTQRLTGYSLQELHGLRFVSLVREDHRAAVAEHYRRQWAEQLTSSYFEFPVITRRGEELWIGQNVQLVREAGRIAGIQAVARDITGRHEVERMKDEFISVASHELRTPLTALNGSLRLLASGRLGELQPSARRLLDIAAENTARLIRLVNDILDLERLKSGRVALQLQPVDAAALMRQAAEMMQPLADQSQVSLAVEPIEAPFVADPDRVIQTLYNLISNAIKFSDTGAEVRVRGAADAAEIRFEVADLGRGIPAEMHEEIFERFAQVDASDSRQKGGTGLGLAICRSIVEQHGGRIELRSAPGEGSVFTVVLPRGRVKEATGDRAEEQRMTGSG
jgi:PAS domain S-box-containing protein